MQHSFLALGACKRGKTHVVINLCNCVMASMHMWPYLADSDVARGSGHKMIRLSCFTCIHEVCMHTGDLVLQQTAISLLEDVAQADPEGLASITAGLVELCHLGYTIPDAQLQQMHGRKKQLMNQHIST